MCSEWQFEPDGHAVAPTLGANDAAVRGYQLLDNCEADASASAAAGATRIRAIKAFENVRQ